MPKTSIIVNSQDTLGKSTQRSFTGTNPKAQNSDLATFGQRLTAMTQNVHGGTVRIDKIDCDNEIEIERPVVFSIQMWDEQSQSMAYKDLPESGIVPIKITSDASKALTITVRVRTGSSSNYVVDVPPRWIDLRVTEGDDITVTCGNISLFTADYPTSSARGFWGINLAVSKTVPCTVVGTVHFDKTDTFKAYDKLITFEITESE